MFILPPRTSWLYRYCISLSSTRRYLLTLSFITICGIVWFFYIYEPMQTRIDKAHAQSNIARAQTIEELREAIAALRTDLAAAKTENASRDDQLHAVLGYIDQVNLALEHCAVQDNGIVVQAVGTFKQIQAFFDQLATSSQRLVPRDVRITRGVDNHFTLCVIIGA